MKTSILSKKTTVLFVAFTICSLQYSLGQFSQKLISESWVKPGGSGLLINNSTTTDFYRNVYVAGSTITGANNTDIIVQKFDPSGLLLWQQSYAGLANLNDAATDVYVDVNYNVYVTGSVVNSVSNGQDIIVLKYNSSGVQQWAYTYHGSNINIDDAGVAIICDAGGNEVFVTGTSGDDQNYYDFNTFSLNSSDGSLVWMQSYDFASEIEIPKRLFIQGSNIYVVGASQDDPNHWEIATVEYDISNGSFISDERTNSNNTYGIDELNDYALDGQGNIYLIGSIDLNGDYDIAVYKLDASLNLVWENFYDINGMDDKGNGIEVVSGDVYLTGSSTTSSFGEEALLMKLNSGGSILWQKEFGGSTGLNDSGKKLTVDSNGKIYVAAAIDDGNNLDSKIYCFDASANMLASASYNGSNDLDDIPQSINIDLDDNIIITGTEQINSSSVITKTAKYQFFDRTYAYDYNGSNPTHLKGSILIRFKADKMLSPVMNARKFHAGRLDEFVDITTISAMQVKTGHDWAKTNAYKVLKHASPEDSISITRLGDTIKADDLWTYLSVDIPENDNHQDLCDSLKTLYTFIREAELNAIYELFDVPDDALYLADQKGLYESATFPGASIHAEDAWDNEVGQFNVKVGVVDAPIYWAHEEFNDGVANLPAADKKIGGGWNYETDQNTNNNILTGYPHGTQVAGIIGARRNNYVSGSSGIAHGVSGIAGGGDVAGNLGVQMFSLGISWASNSFVPMEVIAGALHDGYSNSPNNDMNFGLNLMNASWGTDFGNGVLILDEIKECWKNHCVFIAARGQHSSLNGGTNFAAYPACFNDLYLINVIASGTDGNRVSFFANNGSNFWSSNYGMSGINQTPVCSADVIAPGVEDLVKTTSPYDAYSTFSGTSASAPHVTGVAALMYSQHHVDNGYPNNLGTEDIEEIIQKTALDKGTSGFDLEHGYGMVNADLAVTQVSDPYYVKHLTGNQTWSYVGNVNTKEWIGNGWVYYPNTKKYVVSWDIDVTLPNGHEIIDWWEFEAAMRKGAIQSSFTTFTLNSQEVYTSNMVFSPLGGNHVHQTAEMATYLLNGADADPNNDIWFPMHPDELKYYFSVHVKKSADASLNEIKKVNFVLYPNPTDNSIFVNTINGKHISRYQILDVSGRVIASSETFIKNEITIDVSGFSKGMYYFRAYSEGETETLPFVKK